MKYMLLIYGAESCLPYQITLLNLHLAFSGGTVDFDSRWWRGAQPSEDALSLIVALA